MSLSIGNRDVINGWGFNLNYRWNQAYTWEEGGARVGELDAANILDAAISYKVPSIKTVIKLGATNILGTEYQHIYGGPAIGSQYFLSVNFDEFIQ